MQRMSTQLDIHIHFGSHFVNEPPLKYVDRDVEVRGEFYIDYLNFLYVRDHIINKLLFGKFIEMYLLELGRARN